MSIDTATTLEQLTARRQAAQEALAVLDAAWLEEVLSAIESGASKVAIARQAGVSRGRIYQLIDTYLGGEQS